MAGAEDLISGQADAACCVAVLCLLRARSWPQPPFLNQRTVAGAKAMPPKSVHGLGPGCSACDEAGGVMPPPENLAGELFRVVWAETGPVAHEDLETIAPQEPRAKGG